MIGTMANTVSVISTWEKREGEGEAGVEKVSKTF